MKIEIDMKKVQEDILVEFIVALENATGCHVQSQEVYVLECSDPKAAAILQTVFGGNRTQAIKKGKKTQKKPSEKKHRQEIYYTILTGSKAGAEHRGPSIGLMLKDGNLEPGTRLSHPKRGELIVVTNGKGVNTLQTVPA